MMRVSSKGQVTIPRKLRQLVGIEVESEVVFAVENGKVTIAPAAGATTAMDQERLERLLRALDDLEGTGDLALDADSVMAQTRDR
ncbi:AbrB/MazE/SpoVT family DNA-binding domain-containing protein [Mangrovibrevibacter kandeliae]|uniref:AbrB/MazE/SpoVT family DNA-binding domain-containing protein n=1 Tax=Mangrovibrevibacter kandeliae TaxID=2968473 RepID=UPI002119A348|nr:MULTISPECIES: AbrB/MazE/SpoVT family DNA-binding domain-containing protein [unclassified Aurantimonas]MCQ8784225.1 AbrB/MazE/SpoVT family DNA-binding domain-containing protein [Aurantimonas sp. CSK15Z-1]MCW4116933.1 AbrB/MazE/SpoVT family DNA-binding domain-containing protein [Aurantimonas sp. MSK8Z-1]